MNKFFLPLSLVALLGLTACASTPPKPLSFDQLGQFSSYPLNAKNYRIAYQAASNMSYGTAEEIALVHAARTTLQQGYQFFKVIDDPSNRSQKEPRKAVVYSNSPMLYPPNFYRRYPGFWYDPFYDQPRVVTIDPTEVSYSIECYKQGSAPNDAFDARLILQSLGQKYGVSPSGQVLIPANPAQS